MHVVIFESDCWRSFAPISLSRPVFQLSCGLGTLLDKQLRATSPTRVTFWVRPGLEEYCRKNVLRTLPCPGEVNVPLNDEPALLLSAQSLNLAQFKEPDHEFAVVDETPSGPVLRQAWTSAPKLTVDDVFGRTDRWMRLLDLPRSMPQIRQPDFIWDLIGWNQEAIVADFMQRRVPSQPRPAGAYHIIQESNLWLGQGVKLSPGCVLDGSKGPVVLADHAIVGANAVVEGPCYVGPNSQVSPLATLRPGTSIGPRCKIGGEVSNTILQGCTNKGHEGFIGDSYIGEWVNLGAGTTTSNLKNTYGEISMKVDGASIKTGRQFLGSLIGDHTKSAIGTRFMTGSYVGYNCMIATSQYPPGFIPSFTFLTDSGPQPYRLDKAAEVNRAVFNRRKQEWTHADEQMLNYVARTAPDVEKT